jgi:NADPH:quinone reductase-like Zn-dependent oxidoreductase
VKAIICKQYGPPEVLRLEDVETPRPRLDEVLVRVYAAAASISDCVIRSGRVKPAMWLPFRIFVGLPRPRHAVLGLELSGEIEEVGARVTRFRPHDKIFAFTGRRFGAYGEYVCLRDGGQYMPTDCVMASKQANTSHTEAATLPTRATLALYFLKRANIESGQKVLIYGASGGVGTFAVQLAKHFGAEVTAVCSTANIDLVGSLGADRVLDYTIEDGRAVGGPYDIIFDAVGPKRNSPLKWRSQAALAPGGRSVSVDTVVKIPAVYLDALKDLVAASKIRPAVDRVYPLAETADAHRYVEAGHKRGGVAITVTVAERTSS